MAASKEAITKPTDINGVILESWAQGFMVGALVIMAAITVANMRRGVLLHKLILIELILGMPHGTFMFPSPPQYGWYLSATAIFLNISWSMHNVIAWMKSKPFLTRKVSLFYIGTVILAQPYWILEIYANFTFFNNINNLFHYTRPYEAIFRDPWWIFTTINLFWNIKRRYEFGLVELMRVSPRFAILLTSMLLSLAFIILDVLSVTSVIQSGLPDGVNPFWKLAFVFKCFTDTIILDDFKTALDKLKQYRMDHLSSTIGMTENRTAALESPTPPSARRPTVFTPWNESRGVTTDERPANERPKPQRDSMDHIDLEMQYWERGDSSRSNTTDSARPAAPGG